MPVKNPIIRYLTISHYIIYQSSFDKHDALMYYFWMIIVIKDFSLELCGIKLFEEIKTHWKRVGPMMI